MSWFKVLIISLLFSIVACTPKTTQRVSDASSSQNTEANRVNEAPQGEDLKQQGVVEMTFDKKFHDFGTVKKGEKKETTFTYTNTGTEIIDVEIITSCHCTTLEYERTKPIPPGESSVINVLFDSSTKDKKETVVIDIILKNVDKDGYPIIEQLEFTYDLVK